MARFLTTSATSYFLEELIKKAQKYVVLISPYLKVNERMRELLEDKNRQQLEIWIVYGKKHQPNEIGWLKDLGSVKVKYCQNLHAKCYLSEQECIITSLNLYEFSQINNNEMGVLISKADDADLYRDARAEAQRIIRISKEPRFSPRRRTHAATPQRRQETESDGKLSTSKLARKLGVTTNDLLQHMVKHGLLELKNGQHHLTAEGARNGGEYRANSRFGPYFLWPKNIFENPT